MKGSGYDPLNEDDCAMTQMERVKAAFLSEGRPLHRKEVALLADASAASVGNCIHQLWYAGFLRRVGIGIYVVAQRSTPTTGAQALRKRARLNSWEVE